MSCVFFVNYRAALLDFVPALMRPHHVGVFKTKFSYNTTYHAHALAGPYSNTSISLVSSSKISRAEDDALDQPVSKQAAKMAGLSVRNGPLEDAMDIDEPATNGASKRKSRTSISKVNYKDDESSDDAAPLVRIHDTGKPFLWGQVC